MTWEDRLKQLIAPGENQFPYRVVQIKPNRKQDNEIYLLSGREEAIAANGSLFLALYDLAERDRINFEEWFAQFELGFPAHNQFREPENSNYPLLGEKPWRVPGKYPKYRDWTPPELKNKINFRVIEYWPDRSKEGDSIPLSGTDAQLIEHILQIQYTGKGSAQAEETDELIGGGEVKRRGKPQIHIYFKEDDADVEPGYAPVESMVSFRIMGKDVGSISRSDLIQYRDRIESVFASQGGRIWRRGREMATYVNWDIGYQLQLLVRSKADAESLITDFLTIQNMPFERKFFNFNENQSPAEAYPINPGEITFLGKAIKKARRRPIAEIKFQWASFRADELAKPIYLVDLSGNKKVYSL